MLSSSEFDRIFKKQDFFRDNKMFQVPCPLIRGITGQLGGIRHHKKNKKEIKIERRIPTIVGRGICRPMSVDAATLALQRQLSSLSLTTKTCTLAKRPVSSTPALPSSKLPRSTSCKSEGTLSTVEEGSSVDSSSSSEDLYQSSFPASSSSPETSESDHSQGVGKRAVGETYPKFNINTHNAARHMNNRDKGSGQKESCGFLRCVMSELDRKERAEEAARKRARRNANNTFSREKARQIERENQILLKKLLQFEKNNKRPKPTFVPKLSSTRKAEMEKETRRIRRDNAKLYMKIKFARPSDDLIRASELG